MNNENEQKYKEHYINEEMIQVKEIGHTSVDSESYQALEEENYKMSAQLEWYKRFHDYIKASALIDALDYKEVCNFLGSEEDR